jgi:hypothetical protein
MQGYVDTWSFVYKSTRAVANFRYLKDLTYIAPNLASGRPWELAIELSSLLRHKRFAPLSTNCPATCRRLIYSISQCDCTYSNPPTLQFLPLTPNSRSNKTKQFNTNTSPTLYRLLVVASVASFEPQITRIKNNGSCSGISVFYVLYTTMLATYSFALLLWGVLNHERGESYFFPMEEPGVADWLNFVQFAVVWLGQLVLYVSRVLE